MGTSAGGSEDGDLPPDVSVSEQRKVQSHSMTAAEQLHQHDCREDTFNTEFIV